MMKLPDDPHVPNPQEQAVGHIVECCDEALDGLDGPQRYAVIVRVRSHLQARLTSMRLAGLKRTDLPRL
jgi:hypothetical protein